EWIIRPKCSAEAHRGDCSPDSILDAQGARQDTPWTINNDQVVMSVEDEAHTHRRWTYSLQLRVADGKLLTASH
ncbi:hypothetical protein Z043_118762, partial [Scleropages formosus]